MPSIEEEHDVEMIVNRPSVIGSRRVEDDDNSELSKLESNIKEFAGIILDDKFYEPESKRARFLSVKLITADVP